MSNRLMLVRKDNNVSQEELAKAVGVSRQTIYSIEKGKFVPTVVTAIKIAQFFGRSVEDIFDCNEEWYISEQVDIDGELDFIYGQGLSRYEYLKYGKFNFSFNGGAIAAVFNSMILLGKAMPVESIIDEFEANRMPVLYGLAGTDPRRIGEFFDGHNISYVKFNNSDEFEEFELIDNSILIVSYYCKNMIRSVRGIHTISGCIKNNEFEVYNLRDDDTEVTIIKSVNDFFRKYSVICGYILK